jgi:hypothetical protein
MSVISKAAKAQESHLGNLLNQFMYAVIKDHNGESDRLDPFKSMLYQTYDNLMRKKDDPNKADGTENRFSIQTEVKQHLAYILRSCGAEISRVTLAEGTKVEDIISALIEEFQDDSIVAPFLQFGVAYSAYFRETLKNSTDDTNWIQAQIIGMMPALKTKLHLVAEITTAVDKSLRAIAWLLGRSVWFGAEKSVSSEMFIYTLAMPTSNMYSLNTLDSISKEVRPKAPRTKGAKKAVAGAVAVDSATVENAVTADSETVESTEVSVEGIVVNAEINQALEGI